MKRRTKKPARATLRPNTRTPRRNGSRPLRGAKVPRRLRALAGVDPRRLAPGTLYPCDDPRVGTVVPGGRSTPGGRVVACASRGPEGHGYDLFVGGSPLTPRQVAAARAFAEGETRRALRRTERRAAKDASRRRGGRAAEVYGPRESLGVGAFEGARQLPYGPRESLGTGALEPPRPLRYGPRESLGTGAFEDPRSAHQAPGYTVAGVTREGRASAPSASASASTSASAERAVAAAEAAVAECVAAWERQRHTNTARKHKGALNVARHREQRAEAAIDRAVRLVAALGAAGASGPQDQLRDRLRTAAASLGSRADHGAYTVERQPSVPLERPKREAATGRAFGKAEPLDCDASPVRECAAWRPALGYFERLAPFLPASAKQARQRIADLRAWLEGRLPDDKFWQRDYDELRAAMSAEENALGVGLVEAVVVNATRGIGYARQPEYVKSAALDAMAAVELALAEANGKPVDFHPLLEATGLDEHFARDNRSLAMPPPPSPDEAIATVMEYVRTHADGELFGRRGASVHGGWADLWHQGLRGELAAVYSATQREAITLRGSLYRALLPYAKRPKKLAWDSSPRHTFGVLREKFWMLHRLATILVAQQAGLTDPAAIVEREFRAEAEALRARYETLVREHVTRFGPGFASARRAIERGAKEGVEALDRALRDTPALRPAAARAGRDEYVTRLQAQVARLGGFGRGPEETRDALRGLYTLARGDIALDRHEPPFKTDGAYGRPLRLAIEKLVAYPLALLAFEALAAMAGAATGRKNDSYEVSSASSGDKRMVGAAWIDSDAEGLEVFDKARTESAYALWRTMVGERDDWARKLEMSNNTRYLRNLRRPDAPR